MRRGGETTSLPVSIEDVLTVEFRRICSLEHGTTGTKHPAETPTIPHTSAATKAPQAPAANWNSIYGRNVVKASEGDPRDNPGTGGFRP